MVDYSVYVGAYLKVKNPPRDTSEEFHTCPKKSCSQHKQEITAKFCSQCGTEIKLVRFHCQEPLNFDIYEEFDDKLSEAFTECPIAKDTMVFISNKRGAGGLMIDPMYESSIVDMSTQNIQDDLDKFEKSFNKEIKRLKEVFGDKSVSVHFGILNWAS